MKTLVIVHLEPEYEVTAGPLEALVNMVVEYANGFDNVIRVTCEQKQFAALNHFPAFQWIWGLDIDTHLAEEPEKWIKGVNYIPTTGHAFSEILQWMHDLSKDSIYTLVGGGRNECLQDIYDIFKHLKLSVNVCEDLTY